MSAESLHFAPYHLPIVQLSFFRTLYYVYIALDQNRMNFSQKPKGQFHYSCPNDGPNVMIDNSIITKAGRRVTLSKLAKSKLAKFSICFIDIVSKAFNPTP